MPGDGPRQYTVEEVTLPEAGIPKRFDSPELDTIRAHIIKTGNDLKRRHPWLFRFQDIIGLTLLLGSFAGIAALLVYRAALPYPVVFLGVAWLSSIAHEMEHDTIHKCYFRNSELMRDLFYIVSMMCRPNMINSWSREFIHLHHHISSGTKSDVEEVSITNGEKWNWQRLLCTIDVAWNTVFRYPTLRKTAVEMIKLHPGRSQEIQRKLRRIRLPFMSFHYLALFFLAFANVFAFLKLRFGDGGGMLTAAADMVPPAAQHFLGVALYWAREYFWHLALPNMWRFACLILVSSNCHYFEIQAGDVLKQTQVLNSWLFFIPNLFCCNFGGTHAIHHLVISHTMFVRALIAKDCYPVMKANGIRFNDIESLFHANHFLEKSK